MLKEYLKRDKKYPLFLHAKEDLYNLIESDERFYHIFEGVKSNLSDSEKSILEKDIKKYLAFMIFDHYNGDISDFFKKTSKVDLVKLITEDIEIFG